MSATELLVEPSRLSPVQRAVTGLLRSREVAIAGVLVVLLVFTTVKSSSFVFSHDGWRDLLLSPSLLLLLAIGEMVVIVTRNVDLSVGSVLGLSAYATGRLFITHPGIPIIAVFVIGFLFGAVLGCVNGVLVTAFRVPALVITLGTMYIYRGILVHWAGSKQIYAFNLPTSFQDLGTQQVLGIPVLTILGSSSWDWSATTSARPAAAASSTPSGPTRRPPSSTASPSSVASWGRSSCAARSPDSPASCRPRATRRPRPPPVRASSSRPSRPW